MSLDIHKSHWSRDTRNRLSEWENWIVYALAFERWITTYMPVDTGLHVVELKVERTTPNCQNTYIPCFKPGSH